MTASRSASRSSEPDSGERLVVALVRGVHGLRGAVRVEVLTDRPAERFRPGAVLHVEGSAEPLTVASAEAVADGPGWRIVFREVPNRTAAERLRGAYLEAVVGTGRLGRGEYFWHEVIGTTVRGTDGTDLGHVEDVYRVAETEVLVVRGGPGGEFDLPVVRALIRVFAPRRGEIVVDAELLDIRLPASTGDHQPPPARRRARRGGVGTAHSPGAGPPPDPPGAAGPGEAARAELDRPAATSSRPRRSGGT